MCDVLAVRAQTNTPMAAGVFSQIIEVAGRVEFAAAGQAAWQPAKVGAALKPGDRLRTQAQSRAALQLSDRSVVRLDERTTLEIQPPRHAEKRRFSLPSGRLFFFNREQPADVEFETPLATGAIRGTEFVLAVAAGGTLELALLDGLVDLRADTGSLSLQSGEQARVERGQAPTKSPLLNAATRIQWALYYPAVVNPDELGLSLVEAQRFAGALAQYRAGDLLGALAVLPAEAADESFSVQTFRAATLLSVGRSEEAGVQLAKLPGDSGPARALVELIGVIQTGSSRRKEAQSSSPRKEVSPLTSAATASELLARSYALQAQSKLDTALVVAKRAAALAPNFGFAHARVAELEFAFEHHTAALAALERALQFSPRHAQAQAVRGFVRLESGDTRSALEAFDRARELDAALGSAWLGRGLCLLRERRFAAARAAFQAAAALEPQRAIFRSYLGKAASELRDAPAAQKEFRLAKQLDAGDPTGWLYSALHLWQENRLNEAVRDLERSADLNDNRSVFRSQLLLDRDRSVRSANLAAVYEDAGLGDVSRHAAARAVGEDYANFSGHLFLANSYAALEDPNGFNLRYETARQSELLVANLLAPPGAGNLSQVLSQQEHLQFFEPRPFGFSSLTEYRSGGDWREAASAFGTLGGLSYAFDTVYESQRGQRVNEDFVRKSFSLQLKQRVTAHDEAYVQIGRFDSEGGDLAQHYDPSQAVAGFRANELQEPNVYLGWHHAWSPGSHTLLLVSRLSDRLTLTNPQPNVLFYRQSGGVPISIETAPGFDLDFRSTFTLYSAELQHIWQTPEHALVIGGRYQSGATDTRATLNRVFTGVVSDDLTRESLERGNVYAYGHWQIAEPLRLIAGVSYDHVSFPRNTDLPPLMPGGDSRDLVSPKVGLLFAPWNRGLLRASYTKSLGGMFFDNSIRLEPTQIGGFNQAFRSLIPESAAGLVPGTAFETAGVGFDQSFASGTYFGVEAEWLTSDGARTVGIFTNATLLPVPDAPASTRQSLDFRERTLSAYVAQLLGDNFSVGARYRVSEATLTGRFTDIPSGTPGLTLLQQDERAVLHQLSLTANFHHRCGIFAQWESAWYHQRNTGYTPALAGDDFWQHNFFVGYRFPRRAAEVRVGVLNLNGTDYRLNPLNLHSPLPRERTFTASFRLNF
ncbi:MAG: FecR domain-containing protein [Verrucomicrobia bacterium]|nr:FecR domain-containing protein [Verrucomicrobiota bacterium]